jgi:branched-chain amino acid transport system permease protein
MDTHAICRLGVGRTFQVARPFARLTVSENVRAGAIGRAGTEAEADAATSDALIRVGLQARAGATVDTLTSKELRLLEIARALAARPRLLLLDETLAGLGRIEVDELLPVIRRLPAQGVTVVIIEHTMDALLRLADRLLALDHGSVIAEGLPQTVVRNRRVIEAYLGPKWVQHAQD